MHAHELDAVPAQTWRSLAAGNGAWRTPVLASVAPGGMADARIVVLREVSAGRRELTFYTDRRSRKHAQLAAAASVCVVVYDTDERLQVRLYGKAREERDTALLNARWRDLAQAQRALYAADVVAERAGHEKGRENFAAFHITIERFHCLWLDDACNRAAEFDWDGQRWQGRPCRP